jgi:hypothetical protein
MDMLMGFAIRSHCNIPDNTYNAFRWGFRQRISLESKYLNNKFGEEKSRLSPLSIDCCVKSCIAYDGDYADANACPFCGEKRKDAQGRPRSTFHPLPLVPRLQGMFQDAEVSQKLNRSNLPADCNANIFRDKFDGDHVRKLRERTVRVDGRDTGYHYFTDGRDIGLSISLDGFTFYETVGKHLSKTTYNTWLIIATIDNIDPLTRSKRKNIMVLGIIPGPGSPKNMNSYFHWLKNELHLLSIGVLTWDAALREWFLLRAFLLFILGDMPAIAYIMNMKGHNGKCPCRSCYISGCRDVEGGKTNYYPALLQPDGRSISIQHLLTQNNRTHETFIEDVEEIERAEAAGIKTRIHNAQKASGINGRSILMEIDSVDFTRSFPHDIMHLAGLNTIPNLVALWTGTFSGILRNQGSGSYLISKQDWEIVGSRTAEASTLIPSEFSRALPDIARKPDLNAEGWFFWFVALAPYVLDGILQESYYKHAMDLVAIIRTCLSFKITREEVEGSLTDACHNWVNDYER